MYFVVLNNKHIQKFMTIQIGGLLSLTGGARGGADLTPLHQHQREYEGCHGRGANLPQLRGINPG